MNIVTSGIIVDQRGELLVVKRSDTRTWAVPGGNLDFGEQPDQGVAREVEEETGFKVMPVRLVRLDYLPIRGGTLQMTFRCLLRGGEVKTSLETTHVGFVKTSPIPVRVLPIHKHPIEGALSHTGGAVEWASYELNWLEKLGKTALLNLYYPAMDVKRFLFSQTRYQPLQDWDVRVAVVMRDETGAVRWEKQADKWVLPSRKIRPNQLPWQVAQALSSEKLHDVTGIYTDGGKMVIVFSADATIPHHTYHTTPPENSDPQHIQYAQDATDPDRMTTVFR